MEPTNPRLATLREERDHLSIQISLLKDDDNPNLMRLSEMHRRMDSLEGQIKKYRLTPDAV
jgi:hypothetical protein